ncbi:hypothetical protein GGI25_004197 [Coemansia spiralis]|uniref:Trehalase n=2 Tax=Coemansia TaxID=4863 RepID=A0A9W8G0T4_9FUNG|nr:Six-hairpin glycosidase-like protein [Coemansia spiralis]KAJ1990229.1 hypothetical protein EDC05_004176 [Coemansia umbellata]KAJ2624995.1 hypothetical protein GGI26_001107 [Coemansia sp. RSA 1358]KAJ2674810.1 hypothetical protein GGI25_004197 [Coemansia spiralis]
MRLFVLLSIALCAQAKAPCTSPIYCTGDLLHTVQMAKLFADDKTFVDKPTLKPTRQVLSEFSKIGGRNATKQDLLKFVSENFGTEGSELRQTALELTTETPKFLANIKNGLLRAFGQTVHAFWPTLVREQDLSAICDGCATSMLKLKYHFVVPGGRFREIYYWDTFFTIEGLLRSELYDLARSSIRDLAALVGEFGFVPNGARIYYLDRSQPPFLTLMAKLYYEHTGDLGFVEEIYPLLEKEHRFWMDHHSVNVPLGNSSQPAVLNRYFVDTDRPRPESYTTDYALAHSVSPDPMRQAGVYADMATGAETGWDYSTRWVRDPHAANILLGIRTRQVVPVELNALLFQVEVALAELGTLLCKQTGYQKLADDRRSNMQKVFYDADSELYFDYILEDNKRSTVFSVASLWPYWSFRTASAKAMHTIRTVLSSNPGGIPATLNKSGQQWDWPMAWPPLQYVLMQGTRHQDLGLAVDLAQAFVDNVFCAWYRTGGAIPNVLQQLGGMNDTGHMFEKFNSTQIGMEGGGGEYTVQAGFGWTNGVLLWALDTFGAQLKAPVCPGTPLQLVVPTSSAPSAS